VHRNGGAAKIRAEEEAKLRKAVRDTPVVEHIKGRMAQIPPDQFVARVQAIFEERGHRA
jgi:hypothetical protein